MISLHETITVERPRDECFAYIADFTTTPEWDATAFAAQQTTPGPVAVGTVFSVRCRLPVGFVTITYTVTEFEPGTSITLQGECWLFEAVDSIRFDATAQGTRIDYRADFSYRMPFAAVEQALLPGMQRMGRKALRGMARALGDDFAAPTTSRGAERADSLVWPGLALFSKLGYRRGRRRWNPVSASVRGQRVVITGASSGLGLATARDLARRGADLVLVMRNPTRAAEVVEALIEETGNTAIRCEIADLSLMRDVDALVSRLIAEGRPIDVLVNNAGALFNPRQVTDEGLESSFALLLLSPYRLTLGLKPLLAAAPAARVVNVVSGGMYSQKLEVKKLQAREEELLRLRGLRALQTCPDRTHGGVGTGLGGRGHHGQRHASRLGGHTGRGKRPASLPPPDPADSAHPRRGRGHDHLAGHRARGGRCQRQAVPRP
jgi:dehydrogenase/reductase SDR family protein 12